MGIKKLIDLCIIPATLGAVGGYVAQKFGYDFSSVEGFKQATLAAIPAAAFLEGYQGEFRPKEKETLLSYIQNSSKLESYLSGLVSFPILYYLGGLLIGELTGQNINPVFTGIVGGLEGLMLTTKYNLWID